jgi:hypothetical protein
MVGKLKDFIVRRRIIAVLVALALCLAIGAMLCFGSRRTYFDLNCVYPESGAYYEFIIKDKNTAEKIKDGFHQTSAKIGASVVCRDVSVFNPDDDMDTLNRMSGRSDIAAAFRHNPWGGATYQVEFLTLGGDVLGFSCVYANVRYDCFGDDPFSGCPQSADDAAHEFKDNCESKEIE